MGKVHPKRIELLKNGEQGEGAVVYWMSRDMRAKDNWALLFAQQLAIENKKPLFVCFCLADSFLGATLRHYAFMFEGLKEVEADLKQKNIPFYLLKGNPEEEIASFVKEIDAYSLITDFSPLKIKLGWEKEVCKKVNIPFYRVDAHNIVPCHYVSQKQEYSARTIRPKINRLLLEFLTEFPPLEAQKRVREFPQNNWNEILEALKIDKTVSAVEWLKGGEKSALSVLLDFIDNKLDNYDKDRNNPNKEALSNLSPFLHFGHVSAQRIAIEVDKLSSPSKDAFLEQLIVRRELADNFCYYNLEYGSLKGFSAWAQKTLEAHKNDIRAYIYSQEEFEQAQTHDRLWNAAQLQMVTTGKMHGYMRMYWAKKILEWSVSAEEALKTAIYLNDKYELDGRDPNGYVGVAWSIGGVHDRPWFNRDVYGNIRYMSYNGCKSKFNVEEYIKEWVK